MNVFLVLIVAVSLPRLRVSPRRIDTQGYLDHNHTTSINGLFILIVFAAHVRSYIEYQPHLDSWLIGLVTWLGQLMVALFLFYSGYGIGESISNKPGYVRSIPVRRILPTFINFAVAIFGYLLLNFVLGNDVTPSRALLAFIGWTSVGNSNWYIFAILSMWILTFVAFTVLRNWPVAAVVATLVLAVLFTVFMYGTKGPEAAYSYNTVLCYPAGLIYSYAKPGIERAYGSNVRYLMIVAGAGLFFWICRQFAGRHYMFQELHAIAFCLLLVVLSLKIQLRSPILHWCGQHLFWIYVLQRMPMMVLRHFGLNDSHPYMFVTISLIVTILLAAMCRLYVEPLTNRVASHVGQRDR